MEHPQQRVIDEATAELSALAGVGPRVSRRRGTVRLEVDVTESMANDWGRLLAVLNLGTAYGLTDTGSGQVAWLSFTAAKPSAG